MRVWERGTDGKQRKKLTYIIYELLARVRTHVYA